MHHYPILSSARPRLFDFAILKGSDPFKKIRGLDPLNAFRNFPSSFSPAFDLFPLEKDFAAGYLKNSDCHPNIYFIVFYCL